MRQRRPPNIRLTSEPLLGAEFATTSVASRKLRDNRRVWFKRLFGVILSPISSHQPESLIWGFCRSRLYKLFHRGNFVNLIVPLIRQD